MAFKGLTAFVALLALLPCLCSAHALTHFSRNAYTFEALENAHITVHCNDTGVTVECFSDSAGECGFTLSDGNYTLLGEKPGWQTPDVYINLTDDNTRISYFSQSTGGYARFNFADLTLLQHEFCIYEDESGRLQGCYGLNDTVLLSLSYNYTLHPKLSIYEQAGLMPYTAGFLTQITVFLLVLSVLGVFAALFIGACFYVFKKLL